MTCSFCSQGSSASSQPRRFAGAAPRWPRLSFASMAVTHASVCTNCVAVFAQTMAIPLKWPCRARVGRELSTRCNGERRRSGQGAHRGIKQRHASGNDICGDCIGNQVGERERGGGNRSKQVWYENSPRRRFDPGRHCLRASRDLICLCRGRKSAEWRRRHLHHEIRRVRCCRHRNQWRFLSAPPLWRRR